jgi:hypothetical protein
MLKTSLVSVKIPTFSRTRLFSGISIPQALWHSPLLPERLKLWVYPYPEARYNLPPFVYLSYAYEQYNTFYLSLAVAKCRIRCANGNSSKAFTVDNGVTWPFPLSRPGILLLGIPLLSSWGSSRRRDTQT